LRKIDCQVVEFFSFVFLAENEIFSKGNDKLRKKGLLFHAQFSFVLVFICRDVALNKFLESSLYPWCVDYYGTPKEIIILFLSLDETRSRFFKF